MSINHLFSKVTYGNYYLANNKSKEATEEPTVAILSSLNFWKSKQSSSDIVDLGIKDSRGLLEQKKPESALKKYLYIYKNYKNLLEQKEKETKLLQVLTGMAECYKDLRQYNLALPYIKDAKAISKNLDNALKLETEIKTELIKNPQVRKNKKENIKKETLKKAQKLVEDYSPKYKSALNGINIIYDKLRPNNYAEWRAPEKTIAISERFAFSHPTVVAAYLVHETIHAGDRDSVDSITEEQCAYIEAIKFWEQNRGSNNELELDSHTDLYNNSPEDFKEKIENSYNETLSLGKYSPGHVERKWRHNWKAITYQVKDPNEYCGHRIELCNRFKQIPSNKQRNFSASEPTNSKFKTLA